MCIRYLGLVLLIWCPGELHAQSATQSCSAPTLDGGKFSPKRETYANGVYVTYSCDLGRKPAVEGWWARSTCQNGTWSPQPQCIVEEACIPPEIPNAKYTESPTGWYEDGQKIRIKCDEAYELKNQALCTNGLWSSVPVCERSVDACGEPPQVPHAVIVDQRNQELFAADTELQYECVDGYTAEGAGNDKTIVCIAGAWTEGPTCKESCVLDPARYPRLKLSGFQRLVEGERRRIPCLWDGYISDVQCINGAITRTQCCNLYTGRCV